MPGKGKSIQASTVPTNKQSHNFIIQKTQQISSLTFGKQFWFPQFGKLLPWWVPYTHTTPIDASESLSRLCSDLSRYNNNCRKTQKTLSTTDTDSHTNSVCVSRPKLFWQYRETKSTFCQVFVHVSYQIAGHLSSCIEADPLNWRWLSFGLIWFGSRHRGDRPQYYLYNAVLPL